MYNVASRFHTLAIADSPKTRCRIYFITDAVNCWDDNDVQTNGTLLVGAVGDTDSNGRIGQGGVTVTEIFNKDKNLTIGGTVSYQIGMTLVNSDGALNNFAFGRCKVYLDVYDDANSTWLPCPLGVFRIELPVKRKVQLISCTGYDQMQVLNAIADTWWNGLDFTGGLTIANILNSMVTQLGLRLSATSSTNMVNTALSFTTPPIDSVERTYRDILGWIAEATGTVAHFNRDGELDMRQYLTPQIGGNNIVIDTDTTGNQCLSIDVAEYSVSQIDALTIKLTTADQGVTVGSGTNVYTIMDNPFLYGPDVATIQGKLTPIYNRLSAYATYSPISTQLIYDWSIEAGDIIYILNNSTTYIMPIFQQKMVWRGGYVTSELLSSGDTVRPQVSSSERETYRYNVEMATKVGDNEIISKINQTAEQIQIQASKVNLTGYITATNLATAGQTVINGGNITTGTIDASVVSVTNLNASNITSGTMSANKISGGTLSLGGQNNTNGQLYIYDANGVLCGKIDNTGIEEYGEVGGYTQKLNIGAGYLTLSYAGFVLGVLNAGSSGGTHGGTLSLLGSSGYTRAYLSAVSGALYLNDARGNSGIELNGASGIAWIRGLGANAGRGSLSIYGSQQTGYDKNGTPIYVDSDGHRYQYFVDSSGHIATDLGRDTTRSFLTLNSPDGSSDIFLDTLPANGSRFNSPVYTNAGLTTTDATVNGVLDVTHRRCEATLSSAGWYRVCKIASIGRGDYSFALGLNICRQFYYANNEQHSIRLVGTSNNFSFVNEDSKSNTQIIKRIRYTLDSNNNGYVDIYYDFSDANIVYCEFAAHGFYPSLYTIESLQSVGDAPSGETVLTTYEFSANGIRTVTLTSANSSVTINNQKAVQSGKVVSLWVDFTVSTSISGYGYLIYAPTFATSANALVYDTGNTVQTNVRLYADEGNNGLRCYAAFPAGRYVVFITYITTDV